MNKKFFIILFCLFFSTLLLGQGSYNMGTTRNVTSGCGSFIYDNGGTLANYDANRDDTITIYSQDPTIPFVEIRIVDLNIHESDTLFIYNSDVADPTRLVYMGPLNAPWINNTNMIIISDWTSSATIDNSSGAITLRFKSNGTNEAAGFKMEVLCRPACQRINAIIDPTACIPPLVEEDGIFYANVCEYQTLSLSGYGDYYDNDVAYHQTDDSTYFSWNVGDTIYSGWGLTTINHFCDSNSVHEIKLLMQDQRGCQNQNLAFVRVRTSNNPIRIINPLPDVCLGTPVEINVGYSNTSSILVEPITNQFNNSSFSLDSMMYIPDGPNCPIECYDTQIALTEFDPSQIITNTNDISSICFTMEHSFLGDLQFKITCPNGQSTIMHSIRNNGSSINNGIDLGQTITGTSPSCLGDTSLAGVGWNYCWSENTSLGYQYHGIAPHYIYLNSTAICDSTNRQNNTNYYRPFNSFSSLIGCPLNGIWALEICDNWGQDDGWIFGWQLALDPSLFPQAWSYSVLVDEVLWSGPMITSTSDSTAVIQTPEAGIFDYTFTIIDEYGCAYDSILSLHVIETTDTCVVQNGNILSATAYEPGLTYQWIDCDNNYEAIPGETDQSFFATVNGNYALEVTKNGCIGISSCYTIILMGILENTYETQINIYPNPTNGNINLDLGQDYPETFVKIYDIKGKLMNQFLFKDKNVLEFYINDMSGIYLIDVQSGNRKALMKVIKN